MGPRGPNYRPSLHGIRLGPRWPGGAGCAAVDVGGQKMKTDPYGPIISRQPRAQWCGPLADVADLICVGGIARAAGIDRRNLRRVLINGTCPISETQAVALGLVVSKIIAALGRL